MGEEASKVAHEVWPVRFFWAKGKIPVDGSGQPGQVRQARQAIQTSCLGHLPEFYLWPEKPDTKIHMQF